MAEEERCRAGLLDLPDDVLECLYSYVQVREVLRLGATCRQLSTKSVLYWRKITHLDLVPFLQRNARVDVSNAYRFDSSASALLRNCGPYVRSMDLSKFGPLEYGLRLGLEFTILTCCTRLARLELNNRLLDREWLLKLALATKNTLTHLSLSHVYVRNLGGIDDQILSLLLKHWRHLEWLRLKENRQVRLSCHACLPSTLRYLDVQGCQLYTGYLQGVFRACPRLEALSVTYVPDFVYLPTSLMQSVTELHVDSASALVLEDHFALAVGCLTNLRVFAISAHLLSDTLFALVAENMRQLEELSMPGSRPSPLVSSVSANLLELARRLTRLRKISARANPWSRFVLLLLSRFQALKELDVSFAVKERDLVDVWPDIASQTLECLEIRGFAPVTRGSPALVAKEIKEKLAAKCPKLKKIIV